MCAPHHLGVTTSRRYYSSSERVLPSGPGTCVQSTIASPEGGGSVLCNLEMWIFRDPWEEINFRGTLGGFWSLVAGVQWYGCYRLLPGPVVFLFPEFLVHFEEKCCPPAGTSLDDLKCFHHSILKNSATLYKYLNFLWRVSYLVKVNWLPIYIKLIFELYTRGSSVVHHWPWSSSRYIVSPSHRSLYINCVASISLREVGLCHVT